MTKYIVQGGHPLFGEVEISGAKNAAVLAAQMLAIHDARIAALLAEDREKMDRSIAEKDAAIGPRRPRCKECFPNIFLFL